MAPTRKKSGAEPQKWSLRKEIAALVCSLIQERGLTQREAGAMLGISQGRVSELKRGRIDKFSMDKLLSFVRALEQDMDIVIRRKAAQRARSQVVRERGPDYETASITRTLIAEEVQRVPEHQLAELYELVQGFSVRQKGPAAARKKIMDLAGSWAALPEDVFTSFASEVRKRRSRAFSTRRTHATGAD